MAKNDARRYHLSPESLRANLCEAEEGKCPVRMEDGTPSPHGNKGEVKASKERFMKPQEIAAPLKKTPKKAADTPDTLNVDALVGLMNNAPVEDEVDDWADESTDVVDEPNISDISEVDEVDLDDDIDNIKCEGGCGNSVMNCTCNVCDYCGNEIDSPDDHESDCENAPQQGFRYSFD